MEFMLLCLSSSMQGRFSLCGFEWAPAPALCVGTLIFVSHLDFAEGGILAEDTGTQSPAGEGDEAQLGIIKPSTVSMKGPGSQAGLVSPQTEQLVQRLHTQQSPLLYSPVRWKKGTNLTVTQWWNPSHTAKTQLDFNVISLKEKYSYILIGSHLCPWSDRQAHKWRNLYR